MVNWKEGRLGLGGGEEEPDSLMRESSFCIKEEERGAKFFDLGLTEGKDDCFLEGEEKSFGDEGLIEKREGGD